MKLDCFTGNWQRALQLIKNVHTDRITDFHA